MVKNTNLINISTYKNDVIYFEKEMHEILNNFAKYFKIHKQIILDVSIVSSYTSRKLNFEYRQKDKTTDILSFGYDDFDLYDKMPFLNLGELVICNNKIKKQAIIFNHSIKREFLYLFTHGLVHLYGYDHQSEKEKKEMDFIVDSIFNPLKITRND